MSSSAAGQTGRRAHFRHTVARWRGALPLRARLSLFVAVVVAAGIIGVSYLQVRVVEQTIEQALVDAARSTAQTIAEDMETRRIDAGDITDWLHDFIEANPSIRAITLITDEGPGVSVLASTSSLERTEARD